MVIKLNYKKKKKLKSNSIQSFASHSHTLSFSSQQLSFLTH